MTGDRRDDVRRRIDAFERTAIARSGFDDDPGEQPAPAFPAGTGVRRYLYLRFDAPLMSFGASYAPNPRSHDDPFSVGGHMPQGQAALPHRSMLTGLIANALGYERYEGDRLQRLHERLRFAAGRTRPGRIEEDLQAANIGAGDAGWTTRGKPEGRRGGPATYDSPYMRKMRYWADYEVVVMLRVIDDEGPDTAAIAAALTHPERPLFIGRKAMLPAGQIYRGTVAADDAFTALEMGVFDATALIWDRDEGPADALLVSRDDRSWMTGVHAGEYFMHLRDQTPDFAEADNPKAYRRIMAGIVQEHDL